MSVFAGPNFPTTNLAFYVDAGNQKSYPGSGSTWRDLGPNRLSGSITNATYSSSYGGDLVFATNAFVSFSAVIQNFTSFTILSWARPTGNLTDYNGIMFQGQEAYPKTDSQVFSFFVNTSSAGGYGWLSTGDTRYAMPISVNNTYMFGVTATSTQAIQYINGTAQSTTNYSTISSFNSTRAFQIGKSVAYPGFLSTNYFQGTIFTVAVWSRALSAQEITSVYAETRGRYLL